MFFYIDEAGNSGINLFDEAQGVLSYGVLSSAKNLDVLAVAEHRAMLSKVGATALHANQLKVDGLNKIAPDLIALHRKFRLHFDYYFIEKRAFALVTFFNAVFDAGLNEAMKWDWYWTPLRFPLIAGLYELMDEPLLRRSWDLCITPNQALEKKAPEIVSLLTDVLARLDKSEADKRFREIIGDALRFGIANPLKLDFGTYNRQVLSPNAVAFQFVCFSVAQRLKDSGRRALGIFVDRQQQFNAAQQETFRMQGLLAEGLRRLSPTEREKYLAHPFLEGVRADNRTFISHFPVGKVTFTTSNSSIGIQISDVFLWIINRVLKGEEELPEPLGVLAQGLISRGLIDGISVPAMIQRWKNFEAQLPKAEDVPDHLKALSDELVAKHREKVRALNVKGSS